MEWLIYEGERVKLSTTHARKIVRRLGKIRSDIFGEERKIKTRLIKKNLSMLGHKLGYNVYANGLTDDDLRDINVDFANHELLYDLIWYTEEDHYTITSMPLAVECEWSSNNKRNKKV